MKKMSKLLSVVMALALAACMAITAFAASGGETYTDFPETKQSQHIVTVSADVTELGTVYSVKLEWTNLAFSWSEDTEAGWDAVNHVATDATGSWSDSGNGSITVTNNSNADVYAKITYAADANYQAGLADKGVTVETTAVDTATQLKAGNANNISPKTSGADQNQIQATVTVTGTPTEDLSEVTAGTFTAVVGTSAALG